MQNYIIKNVAIVLASAMMLGTVGCTGLEVSYDTSSEPVVSEIVSDETPDEFQDGEIVDEVEPADDDPDDNKSVASTSAATTTTKKAATTTTKKATTTTTKKSIFDFFKPDNTTTTKKTTTTTKNSTTTTKKATTTTKNTTTTTTKNTTTTTTQSAVKTSYSISMDGDFLINSGLTSSALYKKWGNSGIESQGSLFGANYVLVKDTYGSFGVKCSNSSSNDQITVKSSNASVVSIVSTSANSTHTRVGVTLKAVSTGTATITASIPNNSKTFSFTVKVVTESDVISKYESKVMSLINEYRSNAGVAKLTTASNLKSPARTRAKECSQSFSHTRPNGTSFATALPLTYTSGGWSGNENIAKGQSLPGNAVKAWYNSSGHRTTMLSTRYTKGNVGLYITDNGTFYWALEVVGPSGATTGDDTSSTSEENEEAMKNMISGLRNMES